MHLYWIILSVIALYSGAYFIYGRFLAKYLELDPNRKTPAVEINDGDDFVPTSKGFLLGQHFSAISAAGPIVGPILAGLWFGWLPALLWIAIANIFFGAAHDFGILVCSVRHRATSVVDIVKEYFGPRAHLFFSIFVFITLMYVITAFADLTSSSFANPELGGGVATSSLLYLLLSMLMGFCLKVLKMPLGVATAIFLPLVAVAIAIGPKFPTVIQPFAGLSPQQIWNIFLLAYCFIASIVPIWALLQPRGYLGGFFLYVVLAIGMAGAFLGGEKIQYPAFTGFTNLQGAPLFPLLFVTIACGACSGGHGLFCSGTTSKQIAREPDCKAVGYGGMLLEGLVAVLSLSTLMILAKGNPLLSSSPDRIFAEGLSRFVHRFGIPYDFCRAFILLAFTTFIYDTLDVCTRLSRYLLQELTGWKDSKGRIITTFASLVMPLLFVMVKMTDANGNLVPAWKIFWTLFGTSNQLLAALTFMILAVWLARMKKSVWIAVIPMIFMLIMTLWSLGLMIRAMIVKLFSDQPSVDLTGIIAVLLFGLSVMLLLEAAKVLRAPRASVS